MHCVIRCTVMKRTIGTGVAAAVLVATLGGAVSADPSPQNSYPAPSLVNPTAPIVPPAEAAITPAAAPVTPAEAAITPAAAPVTPAEAPVTPAAPVGAAPPRRVRPPVRDLDQPPGEPSPLPSGLPNARGDDSPGHGRRVAGWAMVGVAGVSAALAVAFLTLDTSMEPDPAQARDIANTLGGITAVTALVTGVVGGTLLSSGYAALHVGPTVTPTTVGLAVMLRM
jgi:hypothetical protein